MNFCTLIFYIIMMLNDAVEYFCLVGLIVQRGDFTRSYTPKYDNDKYNPYLMTMLIIWFIFPIIAIIVSFLAYKEFKGMAYD